MHICRLEPNLQSTNYISRVLQLTSKPSIANTRITVDWSLQQSTDMKPAKCHIWLINSICKFRRSSRLTHYSSRLMMTQHIFFIKYDSFSITTCFIVVLHVLHKKKFEGIQILRLNLDFLSIFSMNIHRFAIINQYPIQNWWKTMKILILMLQNRQNDLSSYTNWWKYKSITCIQEIE